MDNLPSEPYSIRPRNPRATTDAAFAFGPTCALGPVLVDDVIVNEVAIRISGWDWLRVLLGRPLHVRVSTPVRVPPPGVAMPDDPDSLYILPGRSESRAWAESVFKRRPRMMIAEAR